MKVADALAYIRSHLDEVAPDDIAEVMGSHTGITCYQVLVNRFGLGKVVATAGAVDFFSQEELFDMVKRHHMGDWGIVDSEDQQANEDAIKLGNRLVSKYEYHNEAAYVITEWDRSMTTVLLPEEY